MKLMKQIAILLVLLILNGCGKGSVSLSDYEAYRYDNALNEIREIESLCEQVSTAPYQEAIVDLLEKAKALKYDYDDEGMNAATMQHCDSLKMRITSCQERAVQVVEMLMFQSKKISLVELHDQLLTERALFPVYLNKGEKLYCEIESSAKLTAKLYNADTERLIKSYKQSNITDSLTITNTGIYLLEIIPNGKQFTSVSMDFCPSESSDLYNRPEINSEQVECRKGDFGAIGTPGVIMHKCFEEPRKFTLRGKIKAAFSGSSKALVAVQVPTGTTDILYSMRIATSESSRADDGMFHDNLTRSYKRIQFMGLPIYEKSTSNGLLNTLLDDNRPIREEDAYCNMYVFRNRSQAKQFQDNTKMASQLSYDIDYSTVGTQSCNGRIPTKGTRTIYLGFENERMRYTNYLWVEVEAVVPKTIYYKTKYTVK